MDVILLEESSRDKHPKKGPVIKLKDCKKTRIVDGLSTRMNDTLLYFQAEKSSSSHKMSKHFENERYKAMKEDFHQSDEKEAEKLLNPGTARKRSMLQKGNYANASKIMYEHKTCLF